MRIQRLYFGRWMCPRCFATDCFTKDEESEMYRCDNCPPDQPMLLPPS